MRYQTNGGIGELAGHGLRAWFWDAIRKSDALSKVATHIMNGETPDQLFNSALRDSLEFAARFFETTKILSERQAKVIQGVAQFLVGDLNNMQTIIEREMVQILPNEIQHNAFVQSTCMRTARCIAGYAEDVLQDHPKNPADPDMFKKVLASYEHYHPQSLHALEERMLGYEGWNFVQKFLVKKLLDILKEEASESRFAQIESKEWELAISFLHQFVTDEFNPLPPLCRYSSTLRIGVEATNAVMHGAQQLAVTTEWVVNHALSEVTNEVVNLAEGVVNLACETSDQLELTLFGEPVPQLVPPNTALKFGSPRENIADSRPPYRGSPETPLATGPEQFCPLGERHETCVAQTVAGTVRRAEVHNHAHLKSSTLRESLEQACDAALADVITRPCAMKDAYGYHVASAFLAERQRLSLKVPAVPATSYYEWGRGMINASWGYGMHMLGYPRSQQNAAHDRLQYQQLEGLYRASGSNQDVMQNASRFLTNAFAEACFLEPLKNLSTGGDTQLLNLEIKPDSILARMSPDGPHYTYTVELLDSGKTAITVEASWQILAYGRDKADHIPQSTSTSALRSSVQVVLTRDENDNIEPAVYPLGITASIDNVIDVVALESA